MQPSENPLLVFVSSVQNTVVDDVTQERAAAIEQIRGLHLTRDWAFEETPASSDAVDYSYLSKVQGCDIFLMIVGRDITEPVEREWETATKSKKPRLVFLKRDVEMTANAASWLKGVDVKYDRYSGADDIAARVRSAIIDEITRGYRRYRIQDADYKSLAESVRSAPVSFVVRTIRPEELQIVSGEFPQLAELYPNLEEWIGRKRVEIIEQKAAAYVATHGGRSAGFALTSDKGQGVRKLSTLYVLPEFQGLHIGPRLLFDVVSNAAKDGCTKMYVTVSEERRLELEPLLTHYGFFLEGVSGRRYREGSWEWVFGKRFVNGVVPLSGVTSLVRTYLLEERGLDVETLTDGTFLARSRHNVLGDPSRGEVPFVVAVYTGIKTDTAYRANRRTARRYRARLVFVAMDRPSEPDPQDICLDAYDLETRFFPVFIGRPVSGLILSIRETYARELIPSRQGQQFLAPTRIQLRTDNVYYRSANSYRHLTRGSPLFFFETQRPGSESQMIGEAKLDEHSVDEPKELFARFGNLGVFTLEKLETTARSHGGRALALRFDWYREFERPLTRRQVQAIIPTYNPTTARRIEYDEVIKLRKAAGWNVNELSFQ